MLKISLHILNVFIISLSLHATTQDSKKAQKFFKNQLEFITNSYAVNEVATGKVQNVVIVDVRSAEDYKKGHIPKAINLPYNEYKGFNGQEETFPGLNKNGYNYVYCYTATCNLAAKAALKFASLGYPVKEIQGGFDGWMNEGKMIEN